MKKTAALLLLIALGSACTENRENRSMIRLTDPELIESFSMPYEGLLNGDEIPLTAFEQRQVLDVESDWYPFVVSFEMGLESPPKSLPALDIGQLRKGRYLMIGPNMGLAHVLPLPSGKPVEVKVKRKLGAPSDSGVLLLPLPALPELSGPYRPGELKALIESSDYKTIRLAPSEGGASASRLLNLPPEIKALVILVTNAGTQLMQLESASLNTLSESVNFLISRARVDLEHPSLDRSVYLESTVRPSLLLPTPTQLTFSEIRIGEEAVFRCALSRRFELSGPVEVLLKGIVRGEGEYELGRWTISANHEGWKEVECDLSDIEGRRTSLSLSSSCESGSKDLPSLIFCGSPAVYFNRPEKTTREFNLILVSLDTMRPDHLGCYGYSRPVSPCMDDLAENNVLFKHVYAQAPYTLPSHVSLFTSLFSPSHGVFCDDDRIPEKLPLLAEILSSNGLDCASFNNGGFMSHEFGFHRGFDLYCEIDPIGDRSFDGNPFNGKRLADGSAGSFSRVLSWIEARQEERFFLFLHTFIVHEYLPPPDLARKFSAECDSRLAPGREVLPLLDPLKPPEEQLSREDITFFINLYDASIRAADDMVAELMEYLENAGLKENTIVVITSDHGEEFLEHGGVRHNRTVYEELIRIPLIVSVPGMQGGISINSVVNQVDIMPSLLELMKIDTNAMLQGRSFVEMMKGGPAQNRVVYSDVDYPGLSTRACIIEGGIKYLEGDTNEQLICPSPAAVELYDLNEDPSELKNLIENEPETSHRFRKRMEKLNEVFQKYRESIKNDSGSISPELRELLNQQGYL